MILMRWDAGVEAGELKVSIGGLRGPIGFALSLTSA